MATWIPPTNGVESTPRWPWPSWPTEPGFTDPGSTTPGPTTSPAASSGGGAWPWLGAGAAIVALVAAYEVSHHRRRP